MLSNEKGEKLTGKQLFSVLDAVCKEGTTVATDDFSGYNILDKETKNKYFHVSVNHSLGNSSTAISTQGVYRHPSSLQREIYVALHR
jgi:hypothetical protein